MSAAGAANATHGDIAGRRLVAQHIGRATFEEPVDVVAWLGAVQAQDYPAAKWALGLRLRGATDADVERAFDDGRDPAHARPAADVAFRGAGRHPLAAGADRRRACMPANGAYSTGSSSLDARRSFARSRTVLERALRDGRHLTRDGAAAALEPRRHRDGRAAARARADARGAGGADLQRPAARQAVHVRAAGRARAAGARPRRATRRCAELARRYFTSHGPATVAGLRLVVGPDRRDARAGIQMAQPPLASEMLDGTTYWSAAAAPVGNCLRANGVLSAQLRRVRGGLPGTAAPCSTPPTSATWTREAIFCSTMGSSWTADRGHVEAHGAAGAAGRCGTGVHGLGRGDAASRCAGRQELRLVHATTGRVVGGGRCCHDLVAE